MKSVKTPSLKLVLATEKSICVKPEEYQCAVGKLLYLSTRTCPDIAFAVSSVARYTAQPTKEHWKAIKHLFRYLVGTINYGIIHIRAVIQLNVLDLQMQIGEEIWTTESVPQDTSSN